MNGEAMFHVKHPSVPAGLERQPSAQGNQMNLGLGAQPEIDDFAAHSLTDQNEHPAFLAPSGGIPGFLGGKGEHALFAHDHLPAVGGAAVAVVCLLIFGGSSFMLPALLITSAALLLRPAKADRKEEHA